MGQLCEIELEGAPSSVRRARAFVDVTLRSWQLDELCEPAVLLTSELATNAVLHARTPFRVAVQLDPDSVSVEVTDGSPGSPAPVPAPPDTDRGRGLRLVSLLATDWGVRPAAPGKTVWFVMARPPRSDPDEPAL